MSKRTMSSIHDGENEQAHSELDTKHTLFGNSRTHRSSASFVSQMYTCEKIEF